MAYWVGLVCMLLGAVGKHRASELSGGGGCARVPNKAPVLSETSLTLHPIAVSSFNG